MVYNMKYKNSEIKFKEIVGIFNCEDMTVEVDDQIIYLGEDLKDYDGCNISIKLQKEI